jgi:hypothetical protein
MRVSADKRKRRSDAALALHPRPEGRGFTRKTDKRTHKQQTGCGTCFTLIQHSHVVTSDDLSKVEIWFHYFVIISYEVLKKPVLPVGKAGIGEDVIFSHPPLLV